MGFEEVAGLASVHEDIEAAARMEKQIVSSTWMAGQDSSSVPRRHGDLLGASGAQLNIEGRASFCLPHRRHRGEGRVGRRWGVGECWCGVVLQALRCLAFLLCLFLVTLARAQSYGDFLTGFGAPQSTLPSPATSFNLPRHDQPSRASGILASLSALPWLGSRPLAEDEGPRASQRLGWRAPWMHS